MRIARFVLCAAAVCSIAGCHGVEGTWTADTSSEAGSPIARVSFCSDGTFTAASTGRYGGGQVHVMSGHYVVDGDVIALETEGTKREYGITIEKNQITMMHGNQRARLVRMVPRR